MTIEVKLTPDDIANLIIDQRNATLKSNQTIDKILSAAKKECDILTDELDQMQIIYSEIYRPKDTKEKN